MAHPLVDITTFGKVKANSLVFQAVAEDGYLKKADIGDGVSVHFDKNDGDTTILVKRGGDSLVLGMECPFKDGCVVNLGDAESKGVGVLEKACNNSCVRVENGDFNTELSVILNSNPGIDVLTFNYESNLDVFGGGPASYLDKDYSVNMPTQDDAIEFYNLKVGDDFLLLSKAILIDADNKKCGATFGKPANGSFTLTPDDPGFMGTARYPVNVDPVVEVFGTKFDINFTFSDRSKVCNNSEEYVQIGKASGSGYILISDTPETPTWPNEFSSSGLTVEEVHRGVCVTLANEDFLFIGWDTVSDTLRSVKRTAEGVWDDDPIEINSGQAWGWGIEAIVFGAAGDKVMLLQSLHPSGYLVWVTEDGGGSWESRTAPTGIGGNGGWNSWGACRDTVNLEKVFAFFAQGFGINVEISTYDNDTETWTAVVASPGYAGQDSNVGRPSYVHMDEDGKIHYNLQRSTNEVRYCSDYNSVMELKHLFPSGERAHVSTLDKEGLIGFVGDATYVAGISWWNKVADDFDAREDTGTGVWPYSATTNPQCFAKEVWMGGRDSTAQQYYTFTSLHLLPGVSDEDPPTVDEENPAPSATNVVEDTGVNFHLLDETGISLVSVQVEIAQILAVINGVVQAGYTGSLTVFGDDDNNLSVALEKVGDYDPDQTISVAIDAKDTLDNVMTTNNYQFIIRAVDTESPYGGRIVLPINRGKTSNITTLKTDGWKDVDDRSLPLWYQFQVSTDPNFSSDLTTYEWQLSDELQVTLEPNVQYYARVRSADSAEV